MGFSGNKDHESFQKETHPKNRCVEILVAERLRHNLAARNFADLFFFFALFAARSAALGLRLGFGFFHSLLGFSRALGPSFRAFLTLLVDHLLAAQQFDEGLVGAIAFIPPGANNPKIATVTVAETRTDSVE